MIEQTKILHSIPADELTGAISTPVYQISTFVQQSPGIHKGYDYARSNNPIRNLLEYLIVSWKMAGMAMHLQAGLQS
jgi:cystathionine gamma-lyase / homocysteine desulfhydrase